MATTAAPYGFWATNPTKKLAHWVYLLGQPLSRNRVFQNFSGEPPPPLNTDICLHIHSAECTVRLLNQAGMNNYQNNPKYVGNTGVTGSNDSPPFHDSRGSHFSLG